MRWLPFLLCVTVGCDAPCVRYCKAEGRRAEQTFGLLLDGADKEDLFYYDGADFDRSAWNDSCLDAPRTRSCETCSGWVYETFFAPARLADTCETTYTYGLDETETRCAVDCRMSDLRP